MRKIKDIKTLIYNWFLSSECPDLGEYPDYEIEKMLNDATIISRPHYENTILVLYNNNAFDLFNIDDNDKVKIIEIEKQ